MAYGQSGKILYVDLTTRVIDTIPTANYSDLFGGGHGLASALMWDKIKDKTITGFDPANVVTVFPGWLGGTVAPGIGPRSEVQGIGIYEHPVPRREHGIDGLFTRSGFGGRWSTQCKMAGWDGVAVTGKASVPVWINIVNDTVTIEDGEGVWGLDTMEAQQEIWRRVRAGTRWGHWMSLEDKSYTTQRPAVVTCGPCGENLSRIGSLVHDGSHGAGQGGFGGVFGSKNLKAISVLGTGNVEVADPQGLLELRLKQKYEQHHNVDDPDLSTQSNPGVGYQFEMTRTVGCTGCWRNCLRRGQSGAFPEAKCIISYWYKYYKDEGQADTDPNAPAASTMECQLKAHDWAQRMGINGADINVTKNQRYLLHLYANGVIGPGGTANGYDIDTDPVPFDRYHTLDFARSLVKSIAYREGIGDALAEGAIGFAEQHNREHLDLANQWVASPWFGQMQHWSLPGANWAYAGVMGSRDVNSHSMGYSGSVPLDTILDGWSEVTGLDEKCFSHTWQEVDGSNLDNAIATGIYSPYYAKMVAWFRRNSDFWQQSVGCCDSLYFKPFNTRVDDFRSLSPDMEVNCLKAVTGRDISWHEGDEIGRRIWNIDRAFRILQGKTTEHEVFAPYYYEVDVLGTRSSEEASGTQYPFYQDGAWDRKRMREMFLDHEGWAAYKEAYYAEEGWDTTSGFPKRSGLEALSLGYVADELEAAGKLAAE
jgi:aldehyde:ferredoxin oxidoreductase